MQEYQQATQATPGNIAVGEAGQAVGTVKRIGSVGSVQELCIHLVAAAEYSKGLLPFIVGAGSTAALPTNISLGSQSSFSSFADMQDWLKSNKIIVDSLRIVTDDTDNFDEKITVGFRNPNNRNNPEEDINLSEFAKSQGDGLSRFLTIEGLNKAWIPSNYARLSGMKASTEMKIYLRIYQMELSGDYVSIKF